MKIDSNLALNNITSLPRVTNRLHPCNAFTSVKELKFDPIEQKLLQDNLNEIGKRGKEIISLKDLAGLDEEVDLQTVRSFEQLARGYAYHAQSGQKISLWISGEMKAFQVEEIPLWRGIVAYGLKPEDPNESPILLFRGTSLYPSGRGAFPSVVADMDPFGPGALVHKFFSKKIKKWLDETKKTYPSKPYVMGHSLGGAFAAYTALKYTENVHPLTFTHGSVGLSFFAKRKFEKMAAPPKILNFFSGKDPLTKWGHHHVGTDIQIQCDLRANLPPEEKTSWRKITYEHRATLLDKPCELVSKKKKTAIPTWLYISLLTLPFVGGLTALTVEKLLIGNYKSKPYQSLFGPIRWLWHKAYQKSLNKP